MTSDRVYLIDAHGRIAVKSLTSERSFKFLPERIQIKFEISQSQLVQYQSLAIGPKL